MTRTIRWCGLALLSAATTSGSPTLAFTTGTYVDRSVSSSYHHHYHPGRRRATHHHHHDGGGGSSVLQAVRRPSDDQEDDVDDVSWTRRALLTATLLTLPTAAASALPASSILDNDDRRIVLSTSSSNLPRKYDSSVRQQQQQQPTLSTPPLCDSVEERRTAVFERAAPSVVFIDTFAEQRDAFSTNVMEVPLGAGSGFVWDDKGHIVTNYHVVRNAKSAQVAILTKLSPDEADVDKQPKKPVVSSVQRSIAERRAANNQAAAAKSATSDGTYTSTTTTTATPDPTTEEDSSVISYTRRLYKAKVVGVDPGKDIAVLKIDAPVNDLYPIDVGTSTGLHVGQTALAIGNPFGLDHTLTVGVISGMGREVRSPIGRPITNVIQTDAAINPGNSGGPLLNGNGQLIGINTAIYSPSGASAGIGFAIPVDPVRYIVETLIRDGKVVRPVLGISYLESKQAKALGISKGVLVLDVPVGSPAYKAGMRGTKRMENGLIEIGDIIIRVDDTRIDTEADLFTSVERYKPGDFVKVIVNRVTPGSSGNDVNNKNKGVNTDGSKMKEVTIVTQLRPSTDVNALFNSNSEN